MFDETTCKYMSPSLIHGLLYTPSFCFVSKYIYLWLPLDNHGNTFDLSHLIRTGDDSPWIAIDTDVGKSRSFYINVCKPLPYVKNCPGQYGHHYIRGLQ